MTRSVSALDAPPEMRLYRVAEAAELLALSRSKLYLLMDSGDLRCVWVDSARRIPGTAIAEFIAHLQKGGQR